MERTINKAIWDLGRVEFNINPVIQKYENYLRAEGFRETSITRYVNIIEIFLRDQKSILPAISEAVTFRNALS
jgi:hypothetical protein